jgi:hypothetical protein
MATNRKEIKLNPGAQADFVKNTARHSTYQGGRGAGKTFALVVRGLDFAFQPIVPGESPPLGCILTDSFPHLKDIVYPAFYKVARMAGIKYTEVKNQQDRKFILSNGAEIKMRSLDDPDRVRGMEVAWFGIDEGRTFSDDYAYKMLMGCLRQGVHPDRKVEEAGLWVPGENYKRGGWVCSTPNGYDWMYKRFHPKSDKRMPGSLWFNAPTHDNDRNLPVDFIIDLETNWEGLFYEQEVLGRFVGAVSGAVFPQFNPELHIRPVSYDPTLPLYAGWDFGIGDAGVCVFAQVAWVPKVLTDGQTEFVPQFRILGSIEMTDATIAEWANAYYKYVEEHFDGRTPNAMFGDPAGGQRQSVSGTSALTALGTHGVYVKPVRKHSPDESIIILQNLIEGDNRFVISTQAHENVARAVQTHRWKVDDEGRRLAPYPIHDWTSHTCDALRYLAYGVVGLHPRRSPAPAQPAAERGTMGFVLDQIMRETEVTEMGGEIPQLEWHPDRVADVSGW